MTQTQMHDIVVLGATPAGLAAAYYLARKKHDVAVVDSPHQSIECPLTDWLPKPFFQMSGLPGGLAKLAMAEAFSNVCYHNAKFTNTVEYKARADAGHFVNVPALIKAMRASAGKAGAKIRVSTTWPAIHLNEDHVEILGSCRVRARILIIAQNRPNDVLSELSIPLRTVPSGSLLVSGLDVPVGHRRPDMTRIQGALHVVELRERTELGLFFFANGVFHVRVISNSVASGNRALELSSMISGLQQASIIPTDLPLARAKGAVWYPPAGAALELETHVAKRCLLAGTAGGFVECITGQSLAPSVHSALLAADVVIDALASKEPQNTLMKYKTSWRKALADYMRPPNTSLHMLLPLLFVNQRIVAKFTRALLYGENI
jgi:flavin-dependent dehydrogenase